MPVNLPDQNWTVPIGADVADNPQAFVDFAADVQGTVVLRYPNTATRDSFDGSRVAGDISFTTGNTWYERWTGVKWLPCTSITAFKAANQIVNNSAVLVNDAELILPLPAIGSRYGFKFGLRYATNTTADIAISFAGPAGSTITFGGAGPDTSAANVFNAASNYTDTVAPASLFFGGGVTANITVQGVVETVAATGNLTLQFAQAVANASNTIMANYSWGILDAIS